MSATATAPPPAARATTKTTPDERFWVRYSPHHELPLSATGSVTLHALVFGLLLLAGVIAAVLGWSGTKPHNTPFELVSGGGGPTGKPNPETGRGEILPPEAIDNADRDKPLLPEIAPVQPLTPQERKNIAPLRPQDEAAPQRWREHATAAEKALAKIDEQTHQKWADGLRRSTGAGGPGDKGGRGKGKGVGVGDGTLPGQTQQGTLTKRQERMLRWSMHFRTGQGQGSGLEYLAQLRGLGAIIAIPVTPGPRPEYKLVRDLQPGAQLQDDDPSQLDRIYWTDDRPESVRSLLTALQPQGLQGTPSHFVAFMPRKLEEYLYQIEKNYQGLDEDQIFETKFLVIKTPGGYDVKVIDQKRK